MERDSERTHIPTIDSELQVSCLRAGLVHCLAHIVSSVALTHTPHYQTVVGCLSDSHVTRFRNREGGMKPGHCWRRIPCGIAVQYCRVALSDCHHGNTGMNHRNNYKKSVIFLTTS